MSRLQQDQFVDEEDEECCPLCVEEFDLSDRNFRPCPCGYQICQFCFNNIKTTMNGLCPACRRPYDEATIEWKTISPEEMAKHKQQIAQKAKKNAQMRQKEAQKAEADSLSRKHLAGLRVVQKNLVYVTGLTPTIREDRLLDTLRGDDYFGQYGKIIKIVVSKARENAQHQQSVGVYVTFARKVDAEACIKAVDASQNGDRTLRAQYGTTKYCSAYLRGEQCNNRNCMFLHEPGEDNDSFTRQDLSMMNSLQTQQPAQSATSRPAPPAHHGPPVAAATPMNRQDSNDPPSPTQDAPGLPATASWGNRAALERRASRSTIASNPSPLVTNAIPAQTSKTSKAEESSKKKAKEKEKEKEKEKDKDKEKDRERAKDKEREKEQEKEKEKPKELDKEKAKSAPSSKPATPQPAATITTRPDKPCDDGFRNLLKTITAPDFKFCFSSAALTEEEFKAIVDFPLLWDPNGGAKRRAKKEKEEELALQEAAEPDVKATQQPAAIADREENEATVGGSLQLGGEPEDGHEPGSSHVNQHTIAPPGQQAFGGNLFGQNTPLAEDFSSLGMNSRNLTPQQQQQLLLSNFKSGTQSSGISSNMQGNQNQQHSLSGNTSGHTRHTSRFSFANDSASASANVQPVANQKLMNQQNSMMPKNTNQFNQMSQHQGLGGQFFSNVQGPPPGLKPTSTPPVSGTGMFGQGHGFATGGLGYGSNTAGRNNNDAMYQDLLRGRNIDGGARVVDAGKQAISLSVEEQATVNVDALVNDADDEQLRAPLTPLGTAFFPGNQSATSRFNPTLATGFNAPAIPYAASTQQVSHSRSSSNQQPTTSNIPPAVPAIPHSPIPPVTPKRSRKGKQDAGTFEAAAPLLSTPSNKRMVEPELRTPTATAPKSKDLPPQTPAGKTPKSSQEGAQSHSHKTQGTRPSPGPGPGSATSDQPKTKTNKKKGNTGAENSPKKEPQKTLKGASTPAAPTPSDKRKAPGKLDLTAASKIVEDDKSVVASPGGKKSTTSVQASSIVSPPQSPATAVIGSPVKRTAAPRTLRVIPTPKAEVAPSLPATTSAPAIPPVANVGKLRSRQASIVSVPQPGTPVSEGISDTASITSATFSRANSPPPAGGKVGTAPVRKKTKSQTKKERQERKRQIGDENVAVEENKSDVEVVQAPIVGRKKKTKKPSNPPKPLVAAPKSRPTSPKAATVEEEHSDTAKEEAKSVPSRKASAASTPEPEPVPEQIKERREITAQSIMADLVRRGEIDPSALEIFKPLSSTIVHAPRNSQSVDGEVHSGLKIQFTEADLEDLAQRKPVRLMGDDGNPDSRTLITPSGKFFWGLSEELEEKVLRLERQIEELKGFARFETRKSSLHSFSPQTTQSQELLPEIAAILKESTKKDISHNRHASDVESYLTSLGTSGLFLPPVRSLDGAAAAAAAHAHFPPAPPQQTPADAGAYLNQFVLPKSDSLPPNQPRPEMAAVGGPPGSGESNISPKGNQFAKAARAVVENGGLSTTDNEGTGTMAADLLSGVFVNGLESLVGAGLGFKASTAKASSLQAGTTKAGTMKERTTKEGKTKEDTTKHDKTKTDGDTVGGKGAAAAAAVDMQGLMQAFESSAGLGGLGLGRYTGNGKRGGGSVLGLEEAEQAMLAARKEHEVLEKRLAALVKRNRKVALGAGK